MVYDARDKYVLLFGGATSSGGVLNDTWTFVNGTWRNITPTLSPPARASGNMVYDAQDGYVLLFGGCGAAFSWSACSLYLNDTWTFEGGVWTKLSPSISPPFRVGGSMAFDGKDRYVVLFGGQISNPKGWPLKSDTWVFVGGNWTRLKLSVHPAARSFANMVYDAKDGYVVLYGGSIHDQWLNDTWRFVKGHWTSLNLTHSPPVNWGGAMAYDVKDAYVLLFAGYSTNDTWEFHGGAWAEVSPATSPPLSVLASMVYDVRAHCVVLFGGWGTSGLINYLWEYSSGNWTLGAQSSPLGPVRASPSQEGAAGT